MPSSSMSRRMAVLFILALGLIVWCSTRIEPPRRPGYTTAIRDGEQLFPIGVSVLEERRILGRPSARIDRLRGTSVRRASGEERADEHRACDLFVRVSHNHWRHYRASIAELLQLGVDAIPETGIAHFMITPTDAIDDDDQDGVLLDAAELIAPDIGVGAAVEIHCTDLADPAARGSDSVGEAR